MQASYYQATVPEFLTAASDAILGELARSHRFALEQQQRDAWLAQIAVMKDVLADRRSGQILFEFAIPRMGKRADVVLFTDGIVLVLEFKVGAATFDRAAIEQTHDYALDLKNFHRGSHELSIVPILIATAAQVSHRTQLNWAPDGVAEPMLTGLAGLSEVVSRCLAEAPRGPITFEEWVRSGYQPTPTIIEAAQALYQHHGVEEISRSDAGARNLGVTASCIAEVIETSKREHTKSICFVTGVPGAGKTLAGLNIATKRAQDHSDEHAVFLSGNGPLVAVLREALARDESAREGTAKKAALRKVSSFVQNIHHFRDEALRGEAAPYERVVIFDEAQRAWDREQASKFMQTKRGHPSFNMSEPEFLVSVMDRHQDWCVVVCLVGGGQEINTGEAGLTEWLSALQNRFRHWKVFISDRLADRDYVGGETSRTLLASVGGARRPELHLAVSMRSFRAEALSSFVGHIVENRREDANRILPEIAARYPIWITRDLETARHWLKTQARGSERYGVLSSSGAHRLRPLGLNIKAKIDAPTWFLNNREDVRSSYFCEEVATEFDIQGLELDWSCVCWDADFRYRNGQWAYYSFRGTRWQQINAADGRLYRKNAYRVLLTRARQGMAIFVPRGSSEDWTRPPSYYDGTYAFLRSCGLQDLPA